jgi:gas vesicle protein
LPAYKTEKITEEEIMAEERISNAGSTLLAFFIGGLVGAGVALLLAPKSGTETRQIIKEFAGDAREKAEGYFEKARGNATTVVDKVVESATSLVDKGKELLEEKKTILTTAVEAGKEAYEKEKEKLATERKG